MFSGRKLFIYWLLSVVLSVGVPMAIMATVNGKSPKIIGPAPTAGAGLAVVPEVIPQPPVTPPPTTPVTPPEPVATTPPAPVSNDGPLIDEDVSRSVSLKGAGGFIKIKVGTRQEASNDGSVVPIVAQRWDVKTTDKVIALTFDDGPSPSNTPLILDALKKYDARATFFVVGDVADDQPDLLKRMVDEGHEIGNHGYSHRTGQATTIAEYVVEMEKTRDVVKQASGADTRWYRSSNMNMSAAMLIAGQKTNHGLSVWTIDTRDWSNISVETIVQSVDPQHIEPGSVVLFHDGGGSRQRTIRAVELVLAALKERGYMSVTLSELVTREAAPR